MSKFGCYPEGPGTKLLRTEAAKAIIIMVSKPYFLDNKVPGPSGLWGVQSHVEASMNVRIFNIASLNQEM